MTQPLEDDDTKTMGNHTLVGTDTRESTLLVYCRSTHTRIEYETHI